MFPLRAGIEGTVTIRVKPRDWRSPSIIREEERLVLDDRPAYRTAELVPAEGRNLRTIEEIPGIQGAVTKKFIRAAVKLIGARTRDRIDNAARCSAIFRGIIRCDHREFLDRVNAHGSANHISRGAVAVIIYADSIDTGSCFAPVVLPRWSTGFRTLCYLARKTRYPR